MYSNTKVELAKKALGRGGSGLYFIEDVLRNRSGGTDLAFSRSWYILLSFNFELILKAILILENRLDTKEEILDSIKSHDLAKLSLAIDVDSLRRYGINKISEQVSNSFISYSVEMSDGRGCVIIQDLIDVRYDFEKEQLRNSDVDEMDRIKNEIKLLLSVVEKINMIVCPS